MYAAEWTKECPIAITVCDHAGIIIHMNPRSVEVFAADGGLALLGRNVLDCHPEPARTKTQMLLDEQCANIYTIEKAGRKKMIAQIPWHQQGTFAGLVELSFEIPADMPHYIREVSPESAAIVATPSPAPAETLPEQDWSTECPIKLMILSRDGTILRMNHHMAEMHSADGGWELLGKSVYDCHPEPARAKLRGIVESAQPTLYTTDRAGVKEMIVLLPWFRAGVHAGLAHLSFVIPESLPHFVRDAAPAVTA